MECGGILLVRAGRLPLPIFNTPCIVRIWASGVIKYIIIIIILISSPIRGPSIAITLLY